MIEQYKKNQPIGYKVLYKLKNSRHFANAYLIETNGYDGGYEFALNMAKIILCNDDLNSPILKSIDDNNYSELKIIQPEGNSIKKEQLLELQEEFSKKPLVGKNKVYIINGAEKLNISSSNSLLKFLEEPQEGIVAILITENKYRLLDTILSRCQIISLNGQISINSKRTTLEKIGELLSDSHEKYQEFIADDKNKEKIEAVLKFIRNYEKNNKRILLYIDEYWFKFFYDKESMSKALLLIIFFYKDVINIKLNCNVEIFIDYKNFILEIAEKNTINKLIKKITLINENRNYLENNANLHLLMDKIIIEVENE